MGADAAMSRFGQRILRGGPACADRGRQGRREALTPGRGGGGGGFGFRGVGGWALPRARGALGAPP
jgi:hypothetical protein